MNLLAKICPKPTAKTPISIINIEFNKNNLYIPLLNNLYRWNDHPLKVVIDPQSPKPRINLYFFEIANALTNPNKKQPIKFTTKIESICHRNKAPGIAPMDIKKNVFFLISIYPLNNKNPNAKAMIPKEEEIINSLNALENLNCKNKS